MTLAAGIPIILAAAGTAVTTVASIAQGQQQAAADKYNAAVAGNEALAVQQQAQEQVALDQRKATLDAGTIAANLGASGAAGGGSGEYVALDVQNQHNLQANTDLYLGQVAANKYLSNQQVATYQADQAVPNSILAAGGALLKGSSSTLADYNALSPSGGSGNGTGSNALVSAPTAVAPQAENVG